MSNTKIITKSEYLNYIKNNRVKKIPKIIHYCWFGGKPLPREIKKYIKSWRKKCPDYKIVEWNEKNFNVYQNKFLTDAYNNKAWAFVSDYARLKIIYDNGGIYLDTDVELKKSLNELLCYDCYLGSQQVGNNVATGLGFGATKHNPIIKAMLDEYSNLVYSEKDKNKIICPLLNTKSLVKFGYTFSEDNINFIENYNTIVLPPEFFDPIAPGDSKNLFTNYTISVHHYTASWNSNSKKFKRKIINFIGAQKIFFIKKILKKFKREK